MNPHFFRTTYFFLTVLAIVFIGQTFILHFYGWNNSPYKNLEDIAVIATGCTLCAWSIKKFFKEKPCSGYAIAIVLSTIITIIHLLRLIYKGLLC